MKGIVALAIAASVVAGAAAPANAQALIGWNNGPSGTVAAPSK